jgi:integrase
MILNEENIQKLKPEAKRKQYMDKETGFGVRVDPNGRKSFFWYMKVKGKPRFRALGKFPPATVKGARDSARRLTGTAVQWKQSGYAGSDPFEKEHAKPSGTPTFAELMEAYIARHVRETANKPAKAEYNVRWIVGKHFSAWLDRPMDSITIKDVLVVKTACGEKRHQANRCTQFVRAIYNWSTEAQDGKVNFWRVAENPAKDVSLYEEKERERFLQRFNEELQKEEHRDLADFLVLAMTTGARKSDILSARWRDVHQEREVWEVPFPKNGKSYNVTLLPAAASVFDRRSAIAADGETFVFPSSASASGHLETVQDRWEAFREKTGIPDLRLHDLRRTVGSYLSMSGANLPQIAKALGHRSLGSVQVYARLADESVRQAREAGQAKMVEMMGAARKRIRAAERKQKLLGAPAAR